MGVFAAIGGTPSSSGSSVPNKLHRESRSARLRTAWPLGSGFHKSHEPAADGETHIDRFEFDCDRILKLLPLTGESAARIASMSPAKPVMGQQVPFMRAGDVLQATIGASAVI